ncbi:histone-lysine N-methyltransferase SETMAR isoform X1 [Corvus moneduloides]|uniref:histone-lysine N-methyltransferase SETMAR isoform X1 n=1 Tax=Corvus moneduloides TaxID=1196302 RepID=UPI001363A20A|nr:histone-lysine N-methyltransferase SETMAR isoform X1 [Corvus moneduloides]
MAELSGGSEPVAVALWPPGEAPPAFQYSPDSVAGADGEIDPTEITFPGCSCRSSSCVAPECPCLCRGENYSSSLCLRLPEQHEQHFSRPVFECNSLCQCGDGCQNRLVQRGLQLRLQVFCTERKGWGVRALEPVPRGRFVCEYAGEVLGFAEAHRRIQAQTAQDPNYIIAVREHLHDERVMETFVDPTHIGNVGRFLNHSCEPNLFMVPVRVDSMVPRLALFAAADISAGEELSYDYSGRFHNLPGTSREHKPLEEENRLRKPCYCGSRTCASFLPWDSSLFSTPASSP